LIRPTARAAIRVVPPLFLYFMAVEHAAAGHAVATIFYVVMAFVVLSLTGLVMLLD
jgi:hypothetical protein